MATTTTRLVLRKPAGSDNVNVTTDISDNMDKIDSAVGLESLTSFPGSPYTGKPVYRSDLGLAYFWDGSAWRNIPIETSFLQATGSSTTITSTSLQDVTGLSFAVKIGTYIVAVSSEWTLNAATILGWGFSGPATSAYRAFGLATVTAGLPNPVDMSTGASFGNAHTHTACAATASNRGLTVTAFVTFTATGTLQFRAQRSGATNAVMNANSYMSAIKIG